MEITITKELFNNTIEPIISQYARIFAAKTKTPQATFDELYSEGLLQSARIAKRYNKTQGTFASFLKTSLSGCFKNQLRDNRLIRVRRKDIDRYNKYYSLKKKQPNLTEEQVLVVLGVTADEMAIIKQKVMDSTTTIDVDSLEHAYHNNAYTQLAIKALKENIPQRIIEALIDVYVNKESISSVSRKYKLSSTLLTQYQQKIKKECSIYIDN